MWLVKSFTEDKAAIENLTTGEEELITSDEMKNYDLYNYYEGNVWFPNKLEVMGIGIARLDSCSGSFDSVSWQDPFSTYVSGGDTIPDNALAVQDITSDIVVKGKDLFQYGERYTNGADMIADILLTMGYPVELGRFDSYLLFKDGLNAVELHVDLKRFTSYFVQYAIMRYNEAKM